MPWQEQFIKRLLQLDQDHAHADGRPPCQFHLVIRDAWSVQAKSLSAAAASLPESGQGAEKLAGLEAQQLAEQLTAQLTDLQADVASATGRANLAEAKVKNLQAALEEAESQASIFEEQVLPFDPSLFNDA